jgi:DNA-binding NtrC family response regulator
MMGFQLRKHFEDNTIVIELIDNPKKVIPFLEECKNNGITPILGIIDYQMPDINGAQLIRIIKKQHPSMKFIMVSGNSSAMQVSDLVEDNYLNFYLSKPWEEDDLINKINNCLPIQIQSI